jgi:hypothetical protein
MTRIVGVVLLLLLAGYFAYGYQEIKKLLEPDTLVPYGAQMLQDRIPDARHAIVKQVSDSAPAWAEQISSKLRGELPGLRSKLEEYVLKETDGMLKQAATISEDRMRKAIRDNKDVLDSHIRELAEHEELSEASAQALVSALEGELQKDLKDQSELVLDTVRSLDTRVRDLAKGEGLDEEELIERRVLMLARRIQLSEADPKPIAPPTVAPLVKESVAPTVTPTSGKDKAGEPSPGEAPASATSGSAVASGSDAASTSQAKPAEPPVPATAAPAVTDSPSQATPPAE